MTQQHSSSSTLDRFRRYSWQPPRAHGDVVEDRSVSFLELFYDLVYVVIIAQAAHRLAEHVSWRGAVEFGSGATGQDGSAFAVVYTSYLLVLTWLWYTVQRQDDEQFLVFTRRYLLGMVGAVVVIGVSAFLKDDARMACGPYSCSVGFLGRSFSKQ